MKHETPETALALQAERKRIAHILHDGLCQDLMGASLMAQVLSSGLSRENHALLAESEKLKTILDKTAAEIHALYQSLETRVPS